MKRNLILCVLPALFLGCVPKSELEKTQSDLAAANLKSSGLRSELIALQKKSDELQTALERNPAHFFGTWKCQTTRESQNLLGGSIAHSVEGTIVLDKSGRGSLVTTVDGSRVESVLGQWARLGEFVVIESNSGFASFKVAAKAETKMTLVNREGKILEFTKIR